MLHQLYLKIGYFDLSHSSKYHKMLHFEGICNHVYISLALEGTWRRRIRWRDMDELPPGHTLKLIMDKDGGVRVEYATGDTGRWITLPYSQAKDYILGLRPKVELVERFFDSTGTR
jgi:hypothetical protein